MLDTPEFAQAVLPGFGEVAFLRSCEGEGKEKDNGWVVFGVAWW